jgi:hypothetical protein
MSGKRVYNNKGPLASLIEFKFLESKVAQGQWMNCGRMLCFTSCQLSRP